MSKLVYGVGLNDADYSVYPASSGKRVMCPFYRVWQDMLKRCYSKSFKEKHKTYAECTACIEWLTFSNFKAWMVTKNWEGNELDKDFIRDGNKVYSPETCVFVSKTTNNFIIDSGSARGDYPIGVYFDRSELKFKAACSNPFTKKQESVGHFPCQHAAHAAWKKRKHELACQLAELQTDERVANVLRLRYA